MTVVQKQVISLLGKIDLKACKTYQSLYELSDKLIYIRYKF